MNSERKDFLNLLSPPGRISVPEAAWKLGFEPDHIFILVNAKMLKPLGEPPPGAMKYFMSNEIEERKNDRKWMAKASELVRLKIKDKNERAAQNRIRNGKPPIKKSSKLVILNGAGHGQGDG